MKRSASSNQEKGLSAHSTTTSGKATHESYSSWTPGMLVAGSRLARRRLVDCILSAGPPSSWICTAP